MQSFIHFCFKIIFCILGGALSFPHKTVLFVLVVVKQCVALLAENKIEGCGNQGVAILAESEVEGCGNQGVAMLAENV